jgi:hypothetical protein
MWISSELVLSFKIFSSMSFIGSLLCAPSTVIGLASVCNDGPNGYKEGLVKGPFDYYVG